MGERKSDGRPCVSVALATHNHERYIADALDSVLAQAVDFDYEIIAGEDCSTDRTREIVLAYRDQWPERISLELPDRNLGFSAMFRRVVERANGRYVALLDGDDYWTSPAKLARQVSFLNKHPDCTICYHNAQVIYEGVKRAPHLYCQSAARPLATLADLLAGNVMPTASVMYRQLPGIDTAKLEGAIFPDSTLYVQLARQGSIGYLPEVMSVYRVHQGGFWSSQVYNFDEGGVPVEIDPWFDTQITFLHSMNSELGPAFLSDISRELANAHFELSCAYATAGNRALARRHLLESWREGWFNGGVSPRRLATGLLRQFAPGTHRALRRAYLRLRD